MNPRAAGHRVFPAGVKNDPRRSLTFRPLVAATSAAGGRPLVTVGVEDRSHLTASLQESMNVLSSTADKLKADMAEQGIMRPVTVLPLRIVHADGFPDVTIPITPDGSSRTTIAWQSWGLGDASDVYNVANDRRLGARIEAVKALAGRDASLLDESDRVLLRLTTMPATVVVGYEADAGSGVTFAEAVEAWVSMIHVDPPRPWGAPAENDTKATAVLESFHQQLRWSDEYIDYLAGNLAPEEAAAAKLWPTLDERALEIMASLGDDDRKTVLNDGLRRLGAGKPRRPERLLPLVELMLRPLRGDLTPNEMGIARTVLANLRGMSEWNRTGWRPSHMPLDRLYQAAVTEQVATDEDTEAYEELPQAGAYAVELAFMAGFWLARYGDLRRQTRGSGTDDREPEHLLRELMTSRYGLLVLHHVVEDGRRGQRPRAIDEDGEEAKDASGDPLFVTTSWLKSKFPVGDSDQDDDDPGTTDYPSAVRRVRGLVDALEVAVRQLVEMRGPSDEKLARELGIKKELVDKDQTKLNWVNVELGLLGRYFEERESAAAPVDAHDDDGAVDG